MAPTQRSGSPWPCHSLQCALWGKYGKEFPETIRISLQDHARKLLKGEKQAAFPSIPLRSPSASLWGGFRDEQCRVRSPWGAGDNVLQLIQEQEEDRGCSLPGITIITTIVKIFQSKRHGMAWDGMGWDGMEWDGMGWDAPFFPVSPCPLDADQRDGGDQNSP